MSETKCTTCTQASAGEAEGSSEGECSKSKRPCGHHCDCVWTQDHCCWCDKWMGADGKAFDTIEEAASSND